jgi:hypothetical protein
LFAARALSLPSVAWVGLHQPRFKLAANLMNSNHANAFQTLAADIDVEVWFDLQFFNYEVAKCYDLN